MEGSREGAAAPDASFALAGAMSLVMEAAAAEVTTELERAGVRSILLKGPAIARWLYRETEVRPSGDVDLLVGIERFVHAEGVLAEMGLKRLPVAGIEHADTWLSETRPLAVELHWSLLGIGAEASKAWDSLSADTEFMQIGGRSVEVLGLPARALHLALHAAQHGSEVNKPLTDLRRALESVPEETWRSAEALARRLDALEAFGAGLRLLPEGRRLAGMLAIPETRSARTILMTQTAPPLSMGLARIASADGVRAKSAMLLRKLFPEPAFMRVWSGTARRGRLGLGLSYLHRLGWVVWRAAPALWAWSRARREARSGSKPSSDVQIGDAVDEHHGEESDPEQRDGG